MKIYVYKFSDQGYEDSTKVTVYLVPKRVVNQNIFPFTSSHSNLISRQKYIFM